jgi:hypothetical protein
VEDLRDLPLGEVASEVVTDLGAEAVLSLVVLGSEVEALLGLPSEVEDLRDLPLGEAASEVVTHLEVEAVLSLVLGSEVEALLGLPSEVEDLRDLPLASEVLTDLEALLGLPLEVEDLRDLPLGEVASEVVTDLGTEAVLILPSDLPQTLPTPALGAVVHLAWIWVWRRYELRKL